LFEDLVERLRIGRVDGVGAGIVGMILDEPAVVSWGL
jgi:hypothetical protein